jgi:hypothetical protein
VEKGKQTENGELITEKWASWELDAAVKKESSGVLYPRVRTRDA